MTSIPRPRASVVRWAAPAVVLAASLATSGYLGHRSEESSELLERQHYDQLTSDSIRAIQERINVYEEVLTGGAALFASSEQVTRKEWADFASTTGVTTRYPGLIGLGVVRRVSPASLPEFEFAQQGSVPGFAVYPVPGGTNAGEKFVITYLEPEEPYRYALGLDLASEPLRRSALERARDSGQAVISDSIDFTGGTGGRGFLMLRPFYSKGADISTVEARRSALLGWVYAPFYVTDFFAGALGNGTPELDIRMYTGGIPDPSALAYDNEPGRASERYDDVRPFALKGASFSVAFAPSARFVGGGHAEATSLYALGGLGSALLAVVTWSLMTSRVRAVELARSATQELEEAMEALRASAAVLEEQASELDTLRGQAEYLAGHDALTGLLNRRAWWEAGLAMELRALAVIDIDHFKRVNDDFGHPTGDAVLVAVADRLTTLVDSRAVIGRLGGEEFGLLFGGDLRAASEVVAEVVTGIPIVPIRVAEFALPISVSAGLARVAGQGDMESRLGDAYEFADAALYEAKSAGRATWRLARDSAAA